MLCVTVHIFHVGETQSNTTSREFVDQIIHAYTVLE